MKDTDRLILICPDCKNEFTLTYGRYRRFDTNHIFRCYECDRIYKSKTRKEQYAKLSPEEKAAWAERTRIAFANMSPEKKQAFSKKSSENSLKHWNSMTPDEKNAFVEKMKQGKKNMSEEDIARWRQRISKAQKNVWSKLDYQQRLEKMLPVFNGSDNFWTNASDDEKMKIYDKISSSLVSYYSNTTPEERKERFKKIGIANKKRWDNYSDEEKLKVVNRLSNSTDETGATEKAFLLDLHKLGLIDSIDFMLCYRTNGSNGVPFIHPDFYKVFGKINPINKAENFPFHRWDFRIYSKHGLDLLVDIDGSIHNSNEVNYKPAGCDYTIRELIDYNDSKRPYQIPPDCEAYIIKCYTDTLRNDCEVLHLISGSNAIAEKLTYEDFLSRISISQIPMKKILKMLDK